MKTALEMLDRMEALVRRVASAKGHTTYSDEARAIVAELPEPVDPDLITARELVASSLDDLTTATTAGWTRMASLREGKWDDSTAVRKALAALRRAREEGVR